VLVARIVEPFGSGRRGQHGMQFLQTTSQK
jgi:hypothetical protein